MKGNVEILSAFAKAWLEKDSESIMRCFTSDCEYWPSVVSTEDECALGKESVKKRVIEMIEFDESESSRVFNIQTYEDFGFWEWEYIGKGGKSTRGCDFFEFRDNLIKSKKAFRRIIIPLK